jgi:CspA family cold shock protein
MSTGTVKWFNKTKGYGFIAPEDNGNDVFVHMTALNVAGIDSLNDNQRVQYELAENGGKVSAINLQLI